MEAPVRLTEAELLARAASGDRSAQAQLATACVSKQFVGVTPFETMVMAEGFARLAATHGRPEDNMLLAGVLRARAHHVAELGDIERATALWAQSEAICEEYPGPPLCDGLEFLAGVLTAEADAGDDAAAIRLAKLSAALSPADADELRCALNTACREIREAEAANG
jgi:hypothetical protein